MDESTSSKRNKSDSVKKNTTAKHKPKKNKPRNKSVFDVAAKLVSDRNQEIINEQLSNYSILSKLEKKTNIPKLFLFLGFVFFIVLLLVGGLGPKILIHTITLVWPAYRSFLVIEAFEKLVSFEEDAGHAFGRIMKDKKKELKTYKELRIGFNMPIPKEYENVNEEKIDNLLASEKAELEMKCHVKIKRYLMYWVIYGMLNVMEYVFKVMTWWIPFYWVIKLLFLWWCGNPRTYGALTIYHKVAPMMRRRQKHMEGWIDVVNQIARQTWNEMTDDAYGLISMHQGSMMQSIISMASRAQDQPRRTTRGDSEEKE